MPGGKGGGGPQETSSTTATTFLPGQKEFYTDLISKLGPLLGNAGNVKFPVADPVANASADTTTAQNNVRSMVGANGAAFTDSVLGANKFLLSDVLFPGSNPALQGTIDAAINPVQDRLMRNILPSLRSGYTSSDNAGSTRQGIAEGIAVGDFSRNAMDATSTIANNAYNTGLDAMVKTLGLAPSTFNAALAPNMALSGVGAQIDNQNQAEINGQITKGMFDTFGPLSYLGNLTNIASGVPTAGSTTQGTAPGPQQPGVGSRLLGGASAGASLATTLGMSTPWGAGIGAVLGLFG